MRNEGIGSCHSNGKTGRQKSRWQKIKAIKKQKPVDKNEREWIKAIRGCKKQKMLDKTIGDGKKQIVMQKTNSDD